MKRIIVPVLLNLSAVHVVDDNHGRFLRRLQSQLVTRVVIFLQRERRRRRHEERDVVGAQQGLDHVRRAEDADGKESGQAEAV